MNVAKFGAEALARVSDRFRDPEFLKRGCVQTISIEAVRMRLGSRWSFRSEVVADFVIKSFEQSFDEVDQILQLDDVTFLILQPAAERVYAEARAFSLLRKIFNYFLGGSLASDLSVGKVSSIGPDGIVQALLSAESPEISPAGSAPPSAEYDNLPGGLNATIIEQNRVKTAKSVYNDGKYCVQPFYDPIWNVAKKVVVSHILKPLIFKADVTGSETLADLEDLSLNDRIRIDTMIFSSASKFIAESTGPRFGLHVPLHQSTLLSHTGRNAIVHSLLQLGDLARTIVIEIHGFEAGAPTFRIAECIAPLRGKCLGISVQAADLSTDVSPWKKLQLSAVSIDFGSFPDMGGDLRHQVRDFCVRAEGVSPALTAHALPTRSRMLMAWAEGFTHLSGEPLNEHFKGSMTPVRYEPRNLYNLR